MRIAEELFGQQVAQQLRHEALLAVDHRRRARRLEPLARVLPDLVEVVEVAQDVGLGPAAGRGADDDAAAEAVLLAEFLDDAAQPVALVARLDLARDADVIDRRHEHEKAAGQRGVRRQARALGAERLLGDLDDDLLAFLQELFDFRLRSAIAPLAAIAMLVFVARVEAVELLDRVDDIRDVEKPVALEADVNERALHAGQHFRDPALVDVPDDPSMPLPLDEDLGDEILLEDGDHRLVPVGRDDHFLLHSQSSMTDRRSKAEQSARMTYQRFSQSVAPEPIRLQLVNRRIRTLRIRPKLASVAIIDDPP